MQGLDGDFGGRGGAGGWCDWKAEKRGSGNKANHPYFGGDL